MLTRIFKAAEDQDYGGYGWTPEWIEGANAGDGRLVAHDVLEHYVDNKGGAEGELMAMGCVIWGRVMSGTLHGNFYLSKEEIIGSDIMAVLREVVYCNQTLKDPGRTYALRDDEYVEDVITKSIANSLKSLKIETENDDHSYNDSIGMTDAEITYRVRGWLRKGARAADKKYLKRHGLDCGNVSYLFDRLKEKVDKYDAQSYLGATMKVSVNLAKREVNVSVKYPYEYD